MSLTDLLFSLDTEIARLQQVRALLAGDSASVRHVTGPKKRRTMSAEARKRIGDATKARWAAGKMGKQSQSRLKKAGPVKKRHTMSAEGRARIAAAQRLRWAKQKKAKAK